jgi:hypothetical protein
MRTCKPNILPQTTTRHGHANDLAQGRRHLRRTQSEFTIHPTAAMIGEAGSLLSKIASRPPIALRKAQSVYTVTGAQSAPYGRRPKGPSLTKAIRSPCSPPRDEWWSLDARVKPAQDAR